jgi:hypothetical protein
MHSRWTGMMIADRRVQYRSRITSITQIGKDLEFTMIDEGRCSPRSQKDREGWAGGDRDHSADNDLGYYVCSHLVPSDWDVSG